MSRWDSFWTSLKDEGRAQAKDKPEITEILSDEEDNDLEDENVQNPDSQSRKINIQKQDRTSLPVLPPIPRAKQNHAPPLSQKQEAYLYSQSQTSSNPQPPQGFHHDLGGAGGGGGDGDGGGGEGVRVDEMDGEIVGKEELRRPILGDKRESKGGKTAKGKIGGKDSLEKGKQKQKPESSWVNRWKEKLGWNSLNFWNSTKGTPGIKDVDKKQETKFPKPRAKISSTQLLKAATKSAFRGFSAISEEFILGISGYANTHLPFLSLLNVLGERLQISSAILTSFLLSVIVLLLVFGHVFLVLKSFFLFKFLFDTYSIVQTGFMIRGNLKTASLAEDATETNPFLEKEIDFKTQQEPKSAKIHLQRTVQSVACFEKTIQIWSCFAIYQLMMRFLPYSTESIFFSLFDFAILVVFYFLLYRQRTLVEIN